MQESSPASQASQAFQAFQASQTSHASQATGRTDLQFNVNTGITVHDGATINFVQNLPSNGENTIYQQLV